MQCSARSPQSYGIIVCPTYVHTHIHNPSSCFHGVLEEYLSSNQSDRVSPFVYTGGSGSGAETEEKSSGCGRRTGDNPQPRGGVGSQLAETRGSSTPK